jgi:hypothetical protein
MFLKKNEYQCKSIYKSLKTEGKIRWGILKMLLNKKELEDWGIAW